MEGAVILDTADSSDGWRLRVLFPERDDVRATTDFCEMRNLTLTIHTIRHLDSETPHQESARFGLTADQREALTLAYKRGYFAVPRAADLEDIAAADISHQAFSERLQRAHNTLIGETLLVGTDSVTVDY